MIHYRSLAGCSRLPMSTLSLVAGKYVPSLSLATQDSHADVKLTSKVTLPLLHLIRHDKVTRSNGQVSLQKIHPFCQAKTLSAINSESLLVENEHMLFSYKSQGIGVYKCPSRHTEFGNIVILDRVAPVTSFYDCPVSAVIENIKAPSIEKSQILEKPGTAAPKMEAKIIMRIRHKKMKKHKLKKLRKRMMLLWQRQRRAREAKKMKIYWKELEDIKKSGEEFNPEEFVKEQLSKAKKGGYAVSPLR